MRTQTRLSFFVLLGLLVAQTQVLGIEVELGAGRNPLSIDFTHTSKFEIHTQSDDANEENDDYQDLRNLIHLLFRLERFALQLRLDTVTFFAEPKLQTNQTPYLDQINLEKVTGSYGGQRLNLQVGDFYATFGRGLALRIRKEDELGLDHSLLGAKVRYRFDQLQATLLTGLLNVLNSDAEWEKAVSDPFDVVTGLELKATHWTEVSPQIHAVAFLLDPFDRLTESNDAPQQAYIIGSGLEVLLGELGTAYAEVDWMGRQFDKFAVRNSWAAYGSCDLVLGPIGLQVEFKSYHDYKLSSFTSTRHGKYQPVEVRYIMGPTLEPDDSEIENNHNISGGRLSVDWRLAENNGTLFGSYAGFVAQDEWATRSQWIYHALLGYEQTLLGRGRARLTLGIRERSDDGANGFAGRIYLKGSVVLPLSLTQSIAFDALSWMHHTKKDQQSRDSILAEGSLVYHWSPYLDLGVTFQFDTQHADQIDFVEIDENQNRQIFYSSNLSLRFFDSRLILRLFAGHSRAGPICIQGGCRILPAFSGVRLETIVRL